MTKTIVLTVLGVLAAVPASADVHDMEVKRSIYEVVRGEAGGVLQEGRSAAVGGEAAQTSFERERAKRPIDNRN